jgi:RNA polymerase sigma factor (TIGR02999 family)
MSEVTQILDAVADGDTVAAERLLPLAYEELRRIAAHKMAAEREGHTLQPTALVHEAYLRLVGPDGEGRDWKSRGHFFAAAAEAMRRILIDSARRKASLKRGGDQFRVTWEEGVIDDDTPSEEVLMVNEALEKLEEENPEYAGIVKLHYFAGLTIGEAAAALGMSESTIDRKWKAAKAWLFREISRSGTGPPGPRGPNPEKK